jgi:hypothetical protein
MRADALGNQRSDALVLPDVRLAARSAAGEVHGLGDRVGHEHDVRAVGRRGERLGRRLGERTDEARMVEVVAQPAQLDAETADRVVEVFSVLPAAGVGRVGTGHEAGRTTYAVGCHLARGVAKVGIPVAVAPVDRQVDTVLGEVLAHRVEQLDVELVDR